MNRKMIIHLLSGGLDSVTLLYDLKLQGHHVHCLLFDYKQRHKQELQWAKHHASILGAPFTFMDLPELGGLTEQSWIVPNRNAVFLSVAVNVASQRGAEMVTIGCNADDAEMFPDCRPEFIEAMNGATKAAGYDVEISAPYLGLSKKAIVDASKVFRIERGFLWSCYKGGAEPCGECPACKKMEAACGA